MKTSTKIGITTLILIATLPHFILPAASILGYKTDLWMGIIGLCGVLFAVVLGLIWAIWSNLLD